jgi:RNA polymerase sigma-70 factor (ECF subfamily)
MKPHCRKDDSDESIVMQVHKDSAIFACLVDRYHPRLMRYVMRLLSLSEQDRDDILQDIFLTIFRNLNEFDHDLKFSAWAYRIAHNAAISYVRKHKKPWQISLTTDDEAMLETVCDEEKSPFHVVAKHYEIKQINEIINLLDSDHRDVLLLRYAEHKDYNEISDILRKPRGTVASLINRGRAKLVDLAIKKGLIGIDAPVDSGKIIKKNAFEEGYE